MGAFEQKIDLNKIGQFSFRIFEDVCTALRGALCYIGDKLQIFKAMKDLGPTTVEELAQKTGLPAFYLRDWLGGMVAGDYIEYDPASERYTLPPEHALVLTDEHAPYYMAGMLEMIVPLVAIVPKVSAAMRNGSGVPPSEYSSDVWEAIERGTAPVYRHCLAQLWIPAMPQVQAKLLAGGTALDVGCGAGHAAITIAKAFPAARVYGYDCHAGSIERARKRSIAEGLDERIQFEVMDGTRLPRRQFDFISAFMILPEVADPVSLLSSIREALSPDGTLLLLDMNAAPRLHENKTPLGRYVYPMSTLYGLPISIANGGAGTSGVKDEGKIRELAEKAGFGSFRKLQLDDGFSALYEMRI
jgi:2-polyprenyl-3-methyl-5-hydroxy-6-metoxy-1,4-benzoquinol methylase